MSGGDVPFYSHHRMLTEPFETRPPLIEGLLSPGEALILAGPPSAGKTWLALALARAVASGTSWGCHFPTAQGAVLVVDEESHAPGLQERLRLLEAGDPLGDDLPIHYAIGHGIRFDRPDAFEHLRRAIETYRPALVTVDSLTRVHGANENSAGEMADLFRNIRGLMRAYGCSFVLLDHLRKKSLINDAEEMLRGSSEKRAFPEAILFAAPDEHRDLRVSHIKSRYTARVPDWTFEIAVDDERATVRYAGAATGDHDTRRAEHIAAITAITDQLGPEGCDADTISGYLEVHRTTATKHLAELVRIGLVRTRAVRGTGGRARTVYELARRKEDA